MGTYSYTKDRLTISASGAGMMTLRNPGTDIVSLNHKIAMIARFQVTAYYDTQEVWILCGNEIDASEAIGFALMSDGTGMKLYGENSTNGSGGYQDTYLCTISAGVDVKVEFIYLPGQWIQFYVNDTLYATVTSNLPISSHSMGTFQATLIGVSGHTFAMILQQFHAVEAWS